MLIAEEKKTKLELDAMSEKDKKAFKLAEDKLKAETDPRDLILKNENLTPAEKKEALNKITIRDLDD